MDLRNCNLHNCDFNDSDFTGVNLSGVSLYGSNLSACLFEEANLEKSDLRTCSNLNIDPAQTSIKQAQISASALSGLLRKYQLRINE